MRGLDHRSPFSAEVKERVPPLGFMASSKANFTFCLYLYLPNAIDLTQVTTFGLTRYPIHSGSSPSKDTISCMKTHSRMHGVKQLCLAG